jgi:hypothetical protein
MPRKKKSPDFGTPPIDLTWPKDSKMPSPAERPDLYDYYDFSEKRSNLSKKYMDAVTPEHVKKLIAERDAKKKKSR